MGKLMVGNKLVKCPECGGQNILKRGRVPSRSGLKQRYICFACGRSFYYSPKPSRKRAKESQNTPETESETE